MTSAALSGWVSRKAPGYTTAKVADDRIGGGKQARRYLAGMDPAVRFSQIVNGPAADRNLDLLCALMATTVDHSTDVGSIIVGLDRLAEVCSPSFDGIVDGLFASGLLTGDSDHYHDPRNSLLHEVLIRRKGMPITLSVVAMEVGKRLGVPIRGIGLPGHFVIRQRVRFFCRSLWARRALRRGRDDLVVEAADGSRRRARAEHAHTGDCSRHLDPD